MSRESEPTRMRANVYGWYDREVMVSKYSEELARLYKAQVELCKLIIEDAETSKIEAAVSRAAMLSFELTEMPDIPETVKEWHERIMEKAFPENAISGSPDSAAPQQNLQWVASGYILTFGGFLLLGGRLGDLLGRRRMLFTGLTIFALASLTAGLATTSGLLVAARLVQGIGAALMAPAALSTLTTTFREGKDRDTALGAWGAISGLAAAAGVFLGGVLAQGPGWRWVFFINPPICVLVLAGALALLADDRRAGNRAPTFDTQGAALITGGMLLLVYSLVRAPVMGWASAQTILGLAGSAVLAAAFAVNERRSRNPLVPFAIVRVKGLVAADVTQLTAFAGFLSMFFFVTLYMQQVLHYTPLRAGAAYLPITAGFAVAGGIASQLITRIGSRPVVVAGSLVAAAGIYYLSRVPLHGSYVTDLLPGFLVMSLGLGLVFVSITAAANAGVPGDKAGLAAGLLNASQQVGSALGLAILSVLAITRTNDLIAANASPVVALDAGYHRALLAGSVLMAAAALIALRISNTRAAAPAVLVNTEAPPQPAPSETRSSRTPAGCR